MSWLCLYYPVCDECGYKGKTVAGLPDFPESERKKLLVWGVDGRGCLFRRGWEVKPNIEFPSADFLTCPRCIQKRTCPACGHIKEKEAA